MKGIIISWKVLFGFALIFAFICDIFGEGIMVMGVILGWILGLLTITQWKIEELERRKMSKNDRKDNKRNRDRRNLEEY